jgi:cytochrome c oxidase subunit 3/cytochrome o ubiquinol oxidase subunit 3
VFEFTTFVKEGMGLTSSPFSSAFFVLTGFHGAHVTIGIVMLLSLWKLIGIGRVTPTEDVKTEIVGLYWHFVDIIWIIIFTVVYLIPIQVAATGGG